MGLLVEGEWRDQWYDTKSTAGRFKRQQSSFRNWITADGSAGPSGDAGFKAEPGRYHLYVSLACPWAHRTLIFRTLKGLEDAISVDVVHYHMGENGWVFDASIDGSTEIDAINETVYSCVNNGVYKAGFATSQEAYEEAFAALFGCLDDLEKRLSNQRYLVGNTLTEADWRAFTTLVRFDPVYVGHFKCNKQSIADYPNLSNYLRELYQMPGIAGTVNLTHIKRHYYGSHSGVNPTGIVPLGPEIDYSAPHDRARFN